MDPRARTVSFAGGDRDYEDVQPQYNWVPGDNEDTLVVDLTGFKNEAEFKKEHLKIQIDNYGNIKVSGERPLGGARWSRFQRILHLPEDCDASAIRATFDDGVLSVVMPKVVREQLRAVAKPPEASPRKPPAEAQAAPRPAKVSAAAQARPAPVPAPAKERAAALAQREPKLPAPIPGAPADATLPPSRRQEDGRSGDKRTPSEKGKAQVGAPADDSRTAAAADKDEAELAADVAERMPSPLVPAEKATPYARKPPIQAAAAVEEEKPILGGMRGVDLGALRSRHKQLLVNVMVAIMVLVGLGYYLIYRYWGTSDGQEQ